MRKAQVFSTDLIIAMIIFIIILLASVWARDYVTEKRVLEDKKRDLEILTENAMSLIVETPGRSTDWNTTIYSLGLNEHPPEGIDKSSLSVLDRDKIEILESNYSRSKVLLGIQGPNYEYRLDIFVWNSTEYVQNYSIGKGPRGIAEFIVRKDRMALMDGNWTRVIIRVWQNCTKC